jgi:hypothetical protein
VYSEASISLWRLWRAKLYTLFAKKNPRPVARLNTQHIESTERSAGRCCFLICNAKRARACTIYKWCVLSPKQPRQICFFLIQRRLQNPAPSSSSILISAASLFAQKKASLLLFQISEKDWNSTAPLMQWERR